MGQKHKSPRLDTGGAHEKSPTKWKRASTDFQVLPVTPTKAVRTRKEATPRKSTKNEPSSPHVNLMVKQELRASVQSPDIPRPRVKTEQAPPVTRHRQRTPPSYCNHSVYDQSLYQTPGPILLSGIYNVSCPLASALFEDYHLTLSLALDSSRGTWWATFRWGPRDFILQMSPGPSTHALGRPCSFNWRLRNLDTGKLTFERKCKGEMTFFEDQSFRACLYEVPGEGPVEFDGRRMPGPNVEDDLQDEWDGIVKEAYRR